MGSTQQTSNVFSIFCRSEKKVYFRPFLWCFYVYFGVLRVNIGVFESFHQYGVRSRSKKHKFQTKLDVENSDKFPFGLKTSIPVSNLTYQIYLTHNLIKTIHTFLHYNKKHTSQTKNLLIRIDTPKTSKNDPFFRF